MWKQKWNYKLIIRQPQQEKHNCARGEVAVISKKFDSPNQCTRKSCCNECYCNWHLSPQDNFTTSNNSVNNYLLSDKVVVEITSVPNQQHLDLIEALHISSGTESSYKKI